MEQNGTPPRYKSAKIHFTLQPSTLKIIEQAMARHGESSKSRAINQIVGQALVAGIPYLTPPKASAPTHLPSKPR